MTPISVERPMRLLTSHLWGGFATVSISTTDRSSSVGDGITVESPHPPRGFAPLQPAVTVGRVKRMHATAPRASLGRRVAALLAGVAVPALLLCACGSSKPAYCVKSSELKSAVSALTHLNLSKEGVAGAEAALRKVQSSAEGVATTAKSEFPQQTEA